MKKFTKVLKKTGALLTMLALLISSVGLVSVSADVGVGNMIDTIDDLWTEMGSQKKVITGSANFSTNDGSTNDHDFMTIDYENGTSGNVVLKSGNDAGDYRGVLSYIGMNSKMGQIRKQKWEVKVKLASADDVVHALAYAGNQVAIFSYYHSSLATPVTFKEGNVQIYDATEGWSNLYVGTVADQWYKVVRYMDFSTDGVNMQRVMLYSVENNGTANETTTLLADSGETWLRAGTQNYRPNGNTLYVMGLDVVNATTGPVMFDDLAAYEIPAAPAMGVSSDVKYETTNKNFTTIDTLWAQDANRSKLTFTQTSPLTVNGRYYVAWDATDKTNFMTIDYENGTSGNVVLKSSNADGTANNGALAFTYLEDVLGAEKKQKWEIKVKLASANDKVEVFPYHRTESYLYAYKYRNASGGTSYGTPVVIENGAIKTKYGSQTTNICSNLQANQWYKIVRYMDFSVDGQNKQRVQVYKIDNNGAANETATLLGDSGSTFIDAGTVTWIDGASKTLRTTGLNVTSATAGPVMFDDFAVYSVADFATLNFNSLAVDTKELLVRFSSPMQAATLNTNAVTLEANGKEVDLKNVKFDADTNCLVLEFNELQYATTYNLDIATNVMKSNDELPQYPAAPIAFSFTTENDPLSVSALSFGDDGSGKVTGSATLINTTAVQRDYLVILAVYDNTTGAMEDIAFKSGKLANTAAEGTVITTDGLAVAAGKHAELFVWDSWKGLTPLTAKLAQ